MVRIGGRAGPLVQSLTLPPNRELGIKLSGNEWSDINEYKSKRALLELGLEETIKGFIMHRGSVTFEGILNYLEFTSPEFYDALKVREASDGSQMVGRRGKAISSDHLIRCWSQGAKASQVPGLPNVQATTTVWALDPESRRALLKAWKEDIVIDLAADVGKIGRAYNVIQEDLDRCFGMPIVQFLKSKRIIACTTTGAAKHADRLAMIRPDVVLVEEAGEILESHVLTALGPATNQLILIGDHK